MTGTVIESMTLIAELWALYSTFPTLANGMCKKPEDTGVFGTFFKILNNFTDTSQKT